MFFNLCLQDYWDILHFAATIVTLSEAKGQSPFATDLFFLYRSTGSKQTLNGLFYMKPLPLKGFRSYLIALLFFPDEIGIERYTFYFIYKNYPT